LAKQNKEELEARTVDNALKELRQRFQSHSETAALDARVLLAEVTGKSTSWLSTHPEDPLTNKQREELERFAQRLEAGEPLPYITGHWEFFGLDFIVSPAVLIPRPETELLIEHAIAWLSANPSKRFAVDVGTGSGIIAVCLASRVHDLYLTAIDVSSQALTIARLNAASHGVDNRITFIEADLLEGIEATFDLICANLPYIPTGTLKELDVYKHEPSLALDGGPDGMGIIRRLLEQSVEKLAPGGLLLLEIESSLGEQALELARNAFPEAEINLRKDYAGRDRLISISCGK